MKTIIPIFGNNSYLILIDIIFEIIKASKSLMKNFANDFFSKACNLLTNNIKQYNEESTFDSEIVCKSLELISIIIKVLPEFIKIKFEESNIIEIIYQLIDLHDVNVNNYLFNLIGEFTNLPKSQLLSRHIEKLIFFLKIYLTSPENFPELAGGSVKNNDSDRNYICTYNNCCWAIGSLSLNFGSELSSVVESCMNILIKILSFPKVLFLYL